MIKGKGRDGNVSRSFVLIYKYNINNREDRNMENIVTAHNPVLKQDYPDADVIRVDDTYYMVSTTMYFMPGGVILRSYNLADWEIASYVFETLDNTPGQLLEGGSNIYGQGMWAASLRYYKGTFYVCFAANDTHKTYLYQADNIEGPWRKQEVKGFYHDGSLFFDDDGRAYIIYGNTNIYLAELTPDLKGPKEGGLHRLLVEDKDNNRLGYEGAHFYKINGRYYVFLVHSLKNEWFRTEACFSSDSLEGEFTGGDVICDDMGYRHSGVAQGGIVDTPDGKWYGIMFQDRGASGRIPVLVPMQWHNKQPVFGTDGKIPVLVKTVDTRPGYIYEPLYTSDDFNYTADKDGKVHLKKAWQWNHTPHNNLWSVSERKGALRLYSGKICSTLDEAYNTLTQRTTEPESFVTAIIDGSHMKDGDYAGITALIGCYGAVALAYRNGTYEIVMSGKEPQDNSLDSAYGALQEEKEYERVVAGGPVIRLKCQVNYTYNTDTAEFFYEQEGKWVPIGIRHKLVFKLDHFTGCRFGLFYYSLKETGGYADFMDFRYGLGQDKLFYYA